MTEYAALYHESMSSVDLPSPLQRCRPSGAGVRARHNVLYGSALALAATVQTWSQETGTPVPDLTHTMIR